MFEIEIAKEKKRYTSMYLRCEVDFHKRFKELCKKNKISMCRMFNMMADHCMKDLEPKKGE